MLRMKRKKALAEEKRQAKEKALEEKKKLSPEVYLPNNLDVVGLEVSQKGDILFVKYNIKDNLAKSLISYGAKTETLSILEAVNSSNASYNRVFVQGYFPMQDSYGNVSDSMILNVSYLPEDVEKINFENLTVIDNIWDLRDSGMIHPELTQ